MLVHSVMSVVPMLVGLHCRYMSRGGVGRMVGTPDARKKAPVVPPVNDLDALELLDKEDLIKIIKSMMGQGVVVTFHGKRSAMEIAKRVRPRQMEIIRDLCVGSVEDQSRNMLIEGENLQAMVTLYKYRGQVDLILTDPPYNTGQHFRYNDKWDSDPNDPDLGAVVTLDDGSRHTKWMKFMMPRLQMMKAMLKPNGVIAICIDDNELFQLGMMMNEVFGEENRIAIINWQKTYSPKNDSKHVSTATEYVLVYAKDKSKAKTGLLERTERTNARYRAPDGDPHLWTDTDLSARAHPKPEDYGIMSPFTGKIYYPPGTRRWQKKKSAIKEALEKWGSPYVYMKDPNATLPSIVLKGTRLVDGELRAPEEVVAKARERAIQVRDTQVWPEIIFTANGEGGPRLKSYLKDTKKGIVPMTYWADEDYEEPLVLGSQSWDHEQSGHSQAGLNELDEIMGRGHGFETVKPLRLFKKIIQLWCPPNGLVMDPFAGSGTTAHAVLELNYETGANRRWILIEQGRPENGDSYARTLTAERIRRVIEGLRPDKDGNLLVSAEPLGGGFEFLRLTNQIDASTVLSMKRDELIDLVITSHWEPSRRGGPTLIRIDDPKYKYLVGRNEQNEGYFLIWDGAGSVGQLDREAYDIVLQEGEEAGLRPPYRVYARYEIYQSSNVQFYKIPDKILAHLGLNEYGDRFHDSEGDEGGV